VTSYQDMLNQGHDPRQKNHVHLPKKITFYEVAETWLQKNAHRWKEVTRQKHQKNLARDIYPLIANQPIDDVSKPDILNIIRPHEAKGHYEIAHRLHDLLRAIFTMAVGASLTENYPFIGLKTALTSKPRIVNQPAISPDEAHEMMCIIKNSTASRVTKLFIEILSHLFCRPYELRLSKWCEFNINDAEWHIPIQRMKMAAPLWVPLSPQVIELLKELRRITGFTPYLFNSPTSIEHQPISETSARKLMHTSVGLLFPK
jgi:integrase